MKTVRLGKTNLHVSRVGIGGIPLTRPTEAEAIRVVRRALDLGVNFIDTARGYWTSEERIGKAIAGRREQVILATKGGAGDKAAILDSIEQSLTQLKTDTIDLWQFHGVNTFEEYEQVIRPGGGLEGAREAVRAGKIRHIGLTGHALNVAQQAVASDLFETVQFPFNLAEKSAADGLVPLARDHDVGFIAMKPFAGGRLNNAGLAIKFLLQFDSVVPDPGIEKVEEIEEIVGLVNSETWELTPQEQQEIEAIRARLSPRFCRQCEYCMPCPQDVFISGVMYLPALWELWPPERFFSWKYVARAVESAQNCIRCGECEGKCPYHLPIREMIEENIEFYRSITQRTAEPAWDQ